MSNPLKIFENLTPPFEMYPFFKGTKDFISNNELRTHLNVQFEYTVVKRLKIKGELGFF